MGKQTNYVNNQINKYHEEFYAKWNNKWSNRFQNRDLKTNIINHKNAFRFLNLDKIQYNDLSVETYTFIYNELQNLVNIYFFETNKQSTIVVISENGKTLFKVIFGQELKLVDLDEYYINFKKELKTNNNINPLFFLISRNEDNCDKSDLDYKKFIDILTQQKDIFSILKHKFFADEELVNIENTIEKIIEGEAVAFNVIFQNNNNSIKCDQENSDNNIHSENIDNNLYSLASFPLLVEDNIYLWKVFVDQIIKLDAEESCQCDNGIKVIKKNVYTSEIILFSHNNPMLHNCLSKDIIDNIVSNNSKNNGKNCKNKSS